MIVRTTTGSIVSLVNTDKQCLYDNDGVKWERYPGMDSLDPYLVSYRETKAFVSVIQLTKEEIKRVINGVHAMQTPTTVEEMRYHALNLPNDYQWIIDQWPDQKLREILMEAEDRHQNPGAVLEAKVYAVIEAEEAAKRAEEEEKQQNTPEEARKGPEKTRSILRGYKSTPKRRTQEGSVSVALEDVSVMLTPKQLEFIERLSECPGWKDSGVNGRYIASQYTEELSDTMNPMAVGAVLTTLREKGIVNTEKTRIGGIKCCVFQLTDTGIKIYNYLAGGRG